MRFEINTQYGVTVGKYQNGRAAFQAQIDLAEFNHQIRLSIEITVYAPIVDTEIASIVRMCAVAQNFSLEDGPVLINVHFQDSYSLSISKWGYSVYRNNDEIYATGNSLFDSAPDASCEPGSPGATTLFDLIEWGLATIACYQEA